MPNYTYELPFSYERYINAIIAKLKADREIQIYPLLNKASINLDTGGYSHYMGGGRSDALSTFITFLVNPNNIDKLEKDEIKDKLVTICDKLIPPKCGFDVKTVSFIPDLEKDWDIEENLSIEIKDQSKNISREIFQELLPEDIRKKGYEMAEVYTFLYAIENSLRIFIEKVGLNELTFSNAMQEKIIKRKEDEDSNEWLSIKNNSDLFYLDFRDLEKIIEQNWIIFKKYFPNQDFIRSKMHEIFECRNKVAHNSYIDKEQRNLIKTYYNVILGQISQSITKR